MAKSLHILEHCSDDWDEVGLSMAYLLPTLANHLPVCLHIL